jgi:ATP adenylyltransferase
MSLEIYWKKALNQTRLSIDEGSLYPLKTKIITSDLYKNNDFIIRKLDTSKFNKNKIYGPKQNPFCPWEKILEIDKIGDDHQLILNKYPVQKGHILLITNNWKPQNGWLDINDWKAIQKVNKDTSGLWFFNSSPIAGASQPHRHFQLLRRSKEEIACPRENWFLQMNLKKSCGSKLTKNIIVSKFNFFENSISLFELYLELCKKLDLGNPTIDKKPRYPYNLLITNKWIAVIKRKYDHIHGFSINGLGFAGYILVTEKSDVNYLKKYGPEKLLESFV